MCRYLYPTNFLARSTGNICTEVLFIHLYLQCIQNKYKKETELEHMTNVGSFTFESEKVLLNYQMLFCLIYYYFANVFSNVVMIQK
jgi:hypothetical protein